MVTVAVIGAATPVGQALLERLDADPAVDRILGVGCDEPSMPVAKLEVRTADVRDQVLAVAIEDADVVVHLGVDDDPDLDEDTRFAVDVHGTRNVLDAVGKVGASRLVHLSGAAVYGAHPDNPLPLTEDAPLRANPAFAPAYHRLLAEELVAEFSAEHPGTAVVTLRPATVLGPRVDHAITRHLLAPRLLTITGSEPPLQFLHLDDLAAALHLAVVGDLDGAYNVAPDGWLPSEEVSIVLGRRRLAVPEAVAFELTRGLWARHLVSVPPGALHYLMHPLVVSAARLKAAGWTPARSNREALREFAAEHHGELRVGRFQLRTRDVVIGGFAVAGALVGLLLGGRSARRARRR
jgi:nucleoside-diphosphate-sugar epimerase